MKKLFLILYRIIFFVALTLYIISVLFDNRMADKIVTILDSEIIKDIIILSFLMLLILEIPLRNSINESLKMKNTNEKLVNRIKGLITYLKSSESKKNKISICVSGFSVAVFKPNLSIILIVIVICNFMLNNFSYVYSQTEIYYVSHYQKATKFYNSKKYDEATTEFKKIISYADSEDYLAKIYNLPIYKDKKIFKSITLGRYDMDNNGSNGNERILWDILEESSDKLVLVSHYAIGYKSLGYDNGTQNWQESYLRKWLNTEFYTKAFSLQEQKLILNNEIESFEINKKLKTSDYVYILNNEEAQKYYNSDSSRKCKVQFFNALNVDSFINGTRTWLRDSNVLFKFSYIDPNGDINYSGTFSTSQYAIRPVICILAQ